MVPAAGKPVGCSSSPRPWPEAAAHPTATGHSSSTMTRGRSPAEHRAIFEATVCGADADLACRLHREPHPAHRRPSSPPPWHGRGLRPSPPPRRAGRGHRPPCRPRLIEGIRHAHCQPCPDALSLVVGGPRRRRRRGLWAATFGPDVQARVPGLSPPSGHGRRTPRPAARAGPSTQRDLWRPPHLRRASCSPSGLNYREHVRESGFTPPSLTRGLHQVRQLHHWPRYRRWNCPMDRSTGR